MTRPKNVVSSKLSDKLVERIDDLAERHGITRSQMIAFLLGEAIASREEFNECDSATIESIKYEQYKIEREKERKRKEEEQKRSAERLAEWKELTPKEQLEFLEKDEVNRLAEYKSK